jgi:hypothetical protein
MPDEMSYVLYLLHAVTTVRTAFGSAQRGLSRVYMRPHFLKSYGKNIQVVAPRRKKCLECTELCAKVSDSHRWGGIVIRV